MSTLLDIQTGYPWLNTAIKAILRLINPILIVLAVAGIIYAIFVGIKFIKADEKNDREEAKQKLIMVIVGIVVIVFLIALFYFVAYNITDIVNAFGFDESTTILTKKTLSETAAVHFRALR